jgi:hypothetical protein
MKWFIIAVVTFVAMVCLVLAIGFMLPVSHIASRTARLKASPEAVWDVINGPPDWRPDVRSFNSLPLRDGRQAWTEISKDGRASTYERIESVPPRRTVTRMDPGLPFGGTWTYEIVPDENGSLLTITENGEVYNPVFRFVARFVMGHTASIDAYLKALKAKLGEAA